jgi:hypothetical protein
MCIALLTEFTTVPLTLIDGSCHAGYSAALRVSQMYSLLVRLQLLPMLQRVLMNFCAQQRRVSADLW